MVNSNDVVKWGYLLDPCFQFQNTAGKPLTDGYIEVYIAGTRDKYYCASDFDGTLHPFQIPLDSLGANIVLADPEQAYDVYVYNKFGSLQMSRYNVSPGNAGGAVASNINITSSDNTINVTHTGNNYDLSIQDTIDRIDNLENIVSGVTGETDYVISTGYGDSGNFVLTNKDYKGIQYLQDMSGWRLKPGHIYQLNFNSKFTLDDNYNTLVEGKLYLDGDMSFSQDWAYSLDDSFDHIKHINGSAVIVVPTSLQYYDLKLKYTFNSVVNCQVDLENISLVDVTSIVISNGGSGSEYHPGEGININSSNYISVDMDYINSQIDIDSKLSSAINIANEYTDNSIEEVIALVSGVTGELHQVNSDWNATSGVAEILNKPDLSVYATHQEVINSVSAVSSVLEQEIQDIPEQVQSDWAQTNSNAVDYIKNKPEETSVEFTGLVAGNNVTITASGDNTVISADIDLNNYATHNEVYSATTSAVSSANSYTDTAIANIDLTPAVEIVSPNNSISVSSVTDSVNNTKTFYLDTNNPETNYWIGEANLSLSDQSSQGQVGYYKDVFDYTTKLNGNLDATKLKKGLYLLTANVMVVADEVNNDLAEIQIVSSSTSAISYTSSVFTHDCSVTDTLGEPMNESHQIATIVRVMYDDTPMSLIARMDDPTTITNELHLWFSDIGLYELQGTSVGGCSSPSASGSYEAGWGVVINGNVISVNPNIIPDVSNLASTTYVDNRIASAINIVESEIPDVSDMATETWVNNQGFLKSQVQSDWTEYNTSDPAYIKNKPNEANLVAGNNITITASGNNIVISSTASAASGITYRAGTGIDISGDVISVDNTVAMKTDIPDVSNFVTSTQVSAIVEAATGDIPSQVQSDWTEDDTSDPSYIQNKPETEDVTLSTLVAGDNITITASGDNVVISSTGGSSGTTYTAGTGIDITNNTISIDNTVALKTDIPDTSDMATKTWVGQQGYLTSIPSTYATDSEVSAAIATAIGSIPAQVQSNWTESASASPAYIQNKPTEVSVDFCPIIAGSNITITASGSSAVISSTGGGGSTYTAGTGIDITSNVISIDDSVVATKTDIPVPVSGASGVKVEDSVISLDNPVGLVAGENITITVSGDSAIIAGQAGGSTYTAGTGIDITNNVISVTDPNKVFIAEYGVTNQSSIRAAYSNSKDLYCRVSYYNDNMDAVYLTLPLIYEEDSMYFKFGGIACVRYNTYKYIEAVMSMTNDWSQTISNYDPLQVQANWNESNSSSKAYIKNKPDLSSFVTSTTASAIAEAEVANVDVCPIIAGQNITITASGSNAVIDAVVDTSTLATKAEVQTVSAAIPDTSDMATQTWVGNQGYLTSIPSTYATDTEVSNAIASATTGMVTYSGNTAINHIQLVSSLPASPDANTLYLIPEV